MSKPDKKPKQRICFNPTCGKPFEPGHYGKRQKVGSSKEHTQVIGCSSCKGSGQKRGEKCYRCGGKGKVNQTCQEWYRLYWTQVRKPPSGIPPAVFAQIELAAKGDQLRHACLIAARESALRKGELLGVTWGDIVDPAGQLRQSFELRGQWDDVEGFKATKTGSGRNAYIMPRGVEVLSRLKRGRADERVFPFTESGIYKWFIHLQKTLDIVKPETGYPYRWHELRHTLIKELVVSGGLTTAKEVGGHKNIQTTMGYAVESPDDIMKKAIQLRSGGIPAAPPAPKKRKSGGRS